MSFQNVFPMAQATRLQATGTVAITSANCCIVRIACNSTGTAGVQLFTGKTSASASAASAIIRFAATVAGATINTQQSLDWPQTINGGLMAVVSGSADPDITIFWVPTGG